MTRRLAGLVFLLLAILSLGLGIDQTFARINMGLAQASDQSGALYVSFTGEEATLTSQADQGRYFLTPSEIEKVNAEFPVSVTLLEYKSSRTVTLLRLEKWDSQGLLSEVYEGHQNVAVPVRSSFLPASYLRSAVWLGVKYASTLFLGAGLVLGLLFWLGGRRAD